MSDWSEFLENVPWFVAGVEVTIPGEPRAWSSAALEELPALSNLLMTATVTPVTVAGREYELLAGGMEGLRRGWLCLPSVREAAIPVHPTHRLFWSVCGGIVERFREPDSWWLNQNSVLTAEDARVDPASDLGWYSWLWRDEGLEVPIDPADYYVVAVEANGNLTLAHRATGEVLLFAPDHAFDGVTALPGCPPYSLLTIDEAPDLTAWIELTATAWL